MFFGELRTALLLVTLLQCQGCASAGPTPPGVGATTNAINYLSYPGDSSFYFSPDASIRSSYFLKGGHVSFKLIDCSDQEYLCLKTEQFEFAVPRRGFTTQKYTHGGYSYFVFPAKDFEVLGNHFAARMITQVAGERIELADVVYDAKVAPVARYAFTEERGLLNLLIMKASTDGEYWGSYWLQGSEGLLAKRIETVTPP